MREDPVGTTLALSAVNMSKTIATGSKGSTHFEIIEVDEGAWRVRVTTKGGAQYLCDYAAGDPRDVDNTNPDGSPTIANVIDAWKTDRAAFRNI